MSVTCPYCSKITVLPFDGVKALPDHFRAKIQIGSKPESQKEAEPKKPKDLQQINMDWNTYYKKLKDELSLVEEAIRAPKNKSPEEGKIKDMRKIQAEIDKMSAQTAIQRALVAGDILKANVAISKGESPPDVDVSEECYNLLLSIHGQKVEQVDFAIEHTKKTKMIFEMRMAKIRKDLRDQADALMVKFVKEVEADVAREMEALQVYEKESEEKIDAQMKQLVEQKTHIAKVLEWAPNVSSQEFLGMPALKFIHS